MSPTIRTVQNRRCRVPLGRLAARVATFLIGKHKPIHAKHGPRR